MSRNKMANLKHIAREAESSVQKIEIQEWQEKGGTSWSILFPDGDRCRGEAPRKEGQVIGLIYNILMQVFWKIN